MDKPRKLLKEISKYKAIIFDLDGTLAYLDVDWLKLKKELSEYCLLKKGIIIEFTPLDQKLFYIKKNFGDKFYDKLLDIVSDFETRKVNYRINKELVDYINSAKNQKIIIYSMNTQKCVDNFVKKHLKSAPEIIISKNNCLEPKPTGKDIVKILCNLSLAKTDCSLVGDSENDYLCGKKAHIKTLIIKK